MARGLIPGTLVAVKPKEMRQVFVVNFHGIGAPKRPVDADEAKYWIDPEQYEAALDTILAHPRGKDVMVTFDDSNESDVEIALDPLLRRGLKAKFFPLAGKIGEPGYLTPEGVRKLRDAGMEIGTHGVAHVRWDQLDDFDLSLEIDRSVSDIEKWTGARVTCVGLPFGAYNHTVLDALRKRGLKEIYSSDGGPRLAPKAPIPRYSVTRTLTSASLRESLDRGFSLPGRIVAEARSFIKALRITRDTRPLPRLQLASAEIEPKATTTIFGEGELVVIVGFRNASDIRDCLAALANCGDNPQFTVLICENGGSAAFSSLVSALIAPDGPCATAGATILTEVERRLICTPETKIIAGSRLQLGNTGVPVLIGQASENLGYAGAINAWLHPALFEGGWKGVWILNPDTQPYPDALAKLVDYTARNHKGMVGSRVMEVDDPDHVCSRGLKWRKLLASTLGVGNHEPTLPAPDPSVVEAQMDAPSGASFYVTRACIEEVGLMNEIYFLYFEDVEWGLRAKRRGFDIGYAYEFGRAAYWRQHDRVVIREEGAFESCCLL